MKRIEEELSKRARDGGQRGRPKNITKPKCNCVDKEKCPLEGNCNVSQVIYKATVVSQGMVEQNYYGQASDFKARYRNHISSFGNRRNKQKCALKKYIWKLQDRNKEYRITWQLVKRSKAYKPGDRMCGLCTDENLVILENIDSPNTLNDEGIGRCFHKAKHKI